MIETSDIESFRTMAALNLSRINWFAGIDITATRNVPASATTGEGAAEPTDLARGADGIVKRRGNGAVDGRQKGPKLSEPK